MQDLNSKVVKSLNIEITVTFLKIWSPLSKYFVSFRELCRNIYYNVVQGNITRRRNKIEDRARSIPNDRRSGPWRALICIFNGQSCYDNKMPLNTCSAVRYGLSLDTRCHRDVLSIVLLREQVTHDHNRKLPQVSRACVRSRDYTFLRLLDTEVSQIDSLERRRVKVLVW